MRRGRERGRNRQRVILANLIMNKYTVKLMKLRSVLALVMRCYQTHKKELVMDSKPINNHKDLI
jgi:hypothetical protein